MVPSQLINIGRFQLKAPEGHIYLNSHLPETYDYVPWNVIGAIIEEGKLPVPTLIDIGANIGDSVAHFRRQCDGSVICVEPADIFFDLLEVNVKQFSDVTTLKALFCPDELKHNVRFRSDFQTGSTLVTSAQEGSWRGETLDFDAFYIEADRSYILKTDTDGFDYYIIGEFLKQDFEIKSSFPILFFEGPSSEQLSGGDLGEWIKILKCVQRSQYNLLIMNNHGLPYCYVGQNEEALQSAINSLSVGYRANQAMCHYYDFIAVSSTTVSHTLTMQREWSEDIFRRD